MSTVCTSESTLTERVSVILWRFIHQPLLVIRWTNFWKIVLMVDSVSGFVSQNSSWKMPGGTNYDIITFMKIWNSCQHFAAFIYYGAGNRCLIDLFWVGRMSAILHTFNWSSQNSCTHLIQRVDSRFRSSQHNWRNSAYKTLYLISVLLPPANRTFRNGDHKMHFAGYWAVSITRYPHDITTSAFDYGALECSVLMVEVDMYWFYQNHWDLTDKDLSQQERLTTMLASPIWFNIDPQLHFEKRQRSKSVSANVDVSEWCPYQRVAFECDLLKRFKYAPCVTFSEEKRPGSTLIPNSYFFLVQVKLGSSLISLNRRLHTGCTLKQRKSFDELNQLYYYTVEKGEWHMRIRFNFASNYRARRFCADDTSEQTLSCRWEGTATG